MTPELFSKQLGPPVECKESGSQDKPNKSYYDPRKWIRSLALECCSCSAWKGKVCVFFRHGPMEPDWPPPKMMEKTRTNIEASIFSGGSHFSQTNSNGHQLSERDGVSWGVWPPTNLAGLSSWLLHLQCLGCTSKFMVVHWCSFWFITGLWWFLVRHKKPCWLWSCAGVLRYDVATRKPF